MKKFFVNVDIGVDLPGPDGKDVHHDVYKTIEADEASQAVKDLVKFGRLVPVEGASDEKNDDSAPMLKEIEKD